MKDRKTIYKYFTFSQYQQEEEYLSDMQEKGWQFSHANIPGFYHFEKCTPEAVTYRLDYNQEGTKNRAEYLKMFSDCGWEHVCDFVGYSYFRKKGQKGAEREEIFCDDASRLDMMNRVFLGRIIPLIIIFASGIFPQFFLLTTAYRLPSVIRNVFTIIYLIMAVLYLILFSSTALQYYQYEKKVSGDTVRTNVKYGSVAALILICLIALVCSFWYSGRSIHTETDRTDGFVVTATRLNSAVEREYDLKAGDTVEFQISHTAGIVYLEVVMDGEKPQFYADFKASGNHEVTILKDGHYKITVSGDRANTNVGVVIKK